MSGDAASSFRPQDRPKSACVLKRRFGVTTQRRELRTPQRFGRRKSGAIAVAIKVAHHDRRGDVGHPPQSCQDLVGALVADHGAESLDFVAVLMMAAADRGVAGRQGHQIHRVESQVAELRQRELGAVAEQQIG